ncbi:bola-like protein [Dissoconium aciculare CBS 342.82]|uniref:Bola-like protein n=1 Tax=Dissoconium aciculare CBS 342.82 TaxID=1314786 RepID=A0A6J3M3M5_9PEZI|nr:bola-like protein [Dissoconium aciculare CBS 342.82]KAF1822104.1 bola-like protein [Dissoconium aciculare CBS 342.82]
MSSRIIIGQLRQQARSTTSHRSPLTELHTQPAFFQPSRKFSSSPFRLSESNVIAPEYLDENERKIFTILKDSFKPSKLEVQDVSGGCGSMYALDIVSEQFTGLTTIKQHRLVNQVLGEEIKKWHGVQLKTKAP